MTTQITVTQKELYKLRVKAWVRGFSAGLVVALILQLVGYLIFGM